jgi:hypothetical protein
MATNASPFIVNIVPLQNLASDIRGTSDVSVLQTQVANLQTMVDTTNHILYADALSNFTPGRAIEIYADLNLSNANLYSDSNLVILNTSTTTTGGSISSVPTIQYGSSSTGAGGSTFVTFSSTFTAEPNVSATFRGSVPVFMSFDTVSISSFKAYSWSNNAAFPSATFQWSAIGY